MMPAVSAPLVFGPGSEASGQQLDTIVAVVDDDVITRSELDSAMASVTAQLRQRGTPAPPRDVLQKQILERLILGQLQVRAAERNGVVVDDQTLNATIEGLAQRNHLTLSQMRAALERDGISYPQFREDIRNELLANRLRQRVVDSQINISEQEVDDQLNVSGPKPQGGGAQEYHIAQILIGVPDGATPDQIDAARQRIEQVREKLNHGADFASEAAAVSDGRQALEGGDLGWRTPEQLPTLFADVVPRLKPGQVSEPIRSPSGFHLVKVLETRGGSGGGSQTVMVPEAHVRHILLVGDGSGDDDAKLSEQLSNLRRRVENGEDFAVLARANSKDSRTAPQGGDLGWIVPGQLGPEFDRVISHLEPGQVSQPFKTQYGWHLAQVEEKRQRQGNTTDLQRAQVRENLFKRRAEEEWELWLRRLRGEAYVEIRL
ncbi:MAG: peptidylprolyl isomerase [Gammaproteobacteria bacterium]|nr:peptidylprolyl isomerase [Gammaproteobacteria bacterium]MCP5425795.1 peptidylprolyl isomerase [Gammaproteobacteria bacterium]MCP5458594.1 peptidylprolyl isomerase [Gammaproteobacteria bacterium]